MSERNWKDRVVCWREEGCSYAQIVERCHQMGRTKVGKAQVHRILTQKYTKKKEYCPSSIVDKTKVQPIFDFVFDAFLDNSQANPSDIVETIKADFGENVTPAILKRIREARGLTTDRLRYGHSVRDTNRAPRVSFCTHHLNLGTMFTRHCFSDESMVQVGMRGRFVYILKGDTSRRVKPRHKFPASLMVWAGISWEGATPLIVLRKNTKVGGGVYQKMIHSVYLEWAQKKYGGKVLLVQDNAPAHTSESTRAYFVREGVQTMDWPAESPDLNPVEMVWALMKSWLRSKQIKTLDALEDGMKEWWGTKLNKSLCRRLILRTQKQMVRVVEAQGAPVYD